MIVPVFYPYPIVPHGQDACATSQGFTLIGVVVVVVIHSILATVVVLCITDNPDKASIVKAKQDIWVIGNQIDLCRSAQLLLSDHRVGDKSTGSEACRAPHW